MKTINVKTRIYGLIILAAIFMSGNVYAQRMQRLDGNQRVNALRLHQNPGQGMGNQNIEQRGMGMMGLNLSEEQVGKMKEFRTSHLKEMLPIRNEMQEKRAHLRTLTTAENLNQKEIDKVVDEIANLTSKQMKLKIAHQQQTRTLLTEDQRVLFDSRTGGQGKRQFARGNAGAGMGAMHSRFGMKSR
ncbi:MAG: hypothetical protein CVU00_10240 [Bacteroidetes bacterium HGW-Bacteroidetes-17]|jgi:Spy/CpxP family protein refolding chaperone|nr:MAG: hypothetical protein CVU00_10240 [Bacteroidetes bacterium HGW-Bacteroidetes-17]